MRTPTASSIALATAGETVSVPVSPTPFGAERTGLVGHLDDDRLKRLRQILERSDLIIEQRAVDQLAFVENHLFEERQAQMGDRRAEQLLLAVLRIDRRAGIADAKELKNFDLAGFGIDLDFRRGRRGKPILGAFFRLSGFRVHGNRRRVDNRLRRECGAEAAELGKKISLIVMPRSSMPRTKMRPPAAARSSGLTSNFFETT